TVRVESYVVELGLSRELETFRSVTTVRFEAVDGARTFVDLIAPTVHEVVLNGVSLPVEDVASAGRIDLAGLAAHNELRVVADAAYMHSGEGLHRFVDPVDK